MKPTTPSRVLTRAEVLELLSPGETGAFRAADTEAHFRRGDQYLDLEHLELGVLRVAGPPSSTEHFLARKAVHEDTWRRILRQLSRISPL